MNAGTRLDLLQEEYSTLQHFYENIDRKGLTIKSWPITVALAAIGTGLLFPRKYSSSAFASLIFWHLEGHWRVLSHFFSARIWESEHVFQNGKWNEEVPLQVYSTWTKEYKKSKDQTLRSMFKQSSLLPHC